MNWQIVGAAAGFAAAGAALEEYRLWKRRRTSIPLDWNPKARAFEPDYRLKRIERWGRISAWVLYLSLLVIGLAVVNSY